MSLSPCLHELIEQQLAAAPDAVALVYAGDGASLTAAELNRRANRLAWYLRELGIGPNVCVAILMDRSLAAMVAFLGVLKAGGAYLPLDPDFPEARLHMIIEDAEVPVVLADRGYLSRINNFDGTVLALEGDVDELTLDGNTIALNTTKETDPPPFATSNDPAYVIYTSGSTGKPKGCIIPHRAIVNRLLWMKNQYGVSAQDRILQKTPFTFDVSVWELFLPMLSGARLVIERPGGHKDNARLIQTIQTEGVTICHFVPSMLRFFLNQAGVEACTGLSRVFVSGEALSHDLMVRFRQLLPAQLHNLYGPTEAAVDVSFWACEPRPDGLVPIGKAIDNITLRILDAQGHPVEAGEAGELHIGGVGLADGYLNRPQLTRERFIRDPFDADPRARLYKTGDKVRRLEDGNIAFLGRLDFQVKVRGLRIELGEIEAVLRRHQAVREAVVLVREADSDDPRLVAYIEADEGVTARELRAFAKTELPEYMLPNRVVNLPKLPVTRHGKVNRAALPWPVDAVETAATVPLATAPATPAQPENALSTTLLGYFADALKAPDLGVDEDLFDRGATSFTMVRIVEILQREHGVRVPMDVFLDAPTVAGIAAAINANHQPSPGVVLQHRAPAATLPAPPALDAAPAPAATNMAQLTALVAEILQTEVQPSDDLFDLGATSFTMVRIVTCIQERLGVTLPMDVFLDHPTVAGIADHLARNQPAATATAATPSGRRAVALPEPVAGAPAPQPKPDSDGPVDRDRLGRYLSLLQCHNGKYHYASAGGLNPIQTYVYVREVADLPPGIYYYHPLEHALYPVNPEADIPADVFYERDRTRFETAPFAVFLVAHLDAIEPVYQDAAPSLTVLEAGYMAHVLTDRAPTFGLEAVSAPGVTFDAVAPLFHNDPNSQFLLCLLVGERCDETRSNLCTYLAQNNSRPSLCFSAFLNRAAGTFPTQEVAERLHREKPAIRRFPAEVRPIALANEPADPRRLNARACRRAVFEEPVPLADFAALLALLRPAPADRNAFTPPLTATVYVRDNGVVGLSQGLYRYDADHHQLVPLCDRLSQPLKHCYTPFNRKHAARARFALFLTADLKRLQPLFGENATYAALLEAGRIGQRLLEQQAGHELGICPIGGMLFDKIRADFALSENEPLIHSFVGGRFVLDPPRPIAADAAPLAVTAPSGMMDLAIVGAAGRFPGAPDLNRFADNLSHGKDVFSSRRFDPETGYHEQGAHRHFGGFLDDIHRFDCLFFGITPVEARSMDPQERLMLETAYACLEDAGRPPSLQRNAGRTGVYIGVMWDEYQHYSSDAAHRGETEQAAADHAAIANRISYCFDFKGPSVAVNTSCSSAMTALHHACTALCNGEVDAALVGGVNLLTHPYHQNLLRHLDMLSPRDQCRAFDREADGWVAGEGVGAVLIKTRAAAERDGDTIQALIRGTHIGHSGRTSRFGAPGTETFRTAIEATLTRHQIPAASLDYIEAAAPGAALADAAEFNALNAVFAGHAPHVGTVKPAVGHLESAAAMSQIARVLQQFRRQQFFPCAAPTAWNPLIQTVENGPELVTDLKPWPARRDANGEPQPRRALINAFGATGSNGHLILEEAPTVTRPADSGPALIKLSADTAALLTDLARNLDHFLANTEAPRLCDLAFTLDQGREPRRERLAAVVDSVAALQTALQSFLATGAGWLRGTAAPAADSAAVNEDDLTRAAQIWIAGGAVKLTYPADVRRISLPTYPFAGERHHIATPAATPQPLADAAAEHEPMLTRLLHLFAEVSEIPVARLEADAGFENYGLTSAMITRLTALLETELGTLPKTLFFQYKTLRDIAAYLTSRNRPSSRTQVTQPPTKTQEPIAVVGMAGRYPGAANLTVFWENLKNGVDAVGPVPVDRWGSTTLPAGQAVHGGWIEDVYAFDPLFFNLNPREAEHMDPQERLFLETAWHTLEDAGYTPEQLRDRLARRVGVFAGVMYGEYALFSNPTQPDGLTLNSSLGSIANRVSHVLDLHGPSLAVDSLCSSSLTALHLAVASLQRGECEAALVGGVNLSLHPNKFHLLGELNMTAKDGRCRSFGAGGTGMVPGEGVGVLMLRPLSAAQRDGDRIHGIVRATAVNHDGHTHGFTVPNPNAQAEMIREALTRADIPATSISYVEAHGTGTPLGDPLEIAGLSQAFDTAETGYCAIGSLKANIGHTEAAAGIAGLTKVLLQMKHATLVPSLHAAEPNPDIPFSETPFTLQQNCSDWTPRERDGRTLPRLACISSFGAGGANAHAVLEEYRATVAPAQTPAAVAVVLSARDEAALLRMVADLRGFLENHPQTALADLAHTLQVGRRAMEERLAFVAQDTASILTTLRAFEAGRATDVARGRVGTGAKGFPLLEDDEDVRALTAKWLAAGRLEKITALWVNGVAVAWPEIKGAQRIALPGYPFARETYRPPAMRGVTASAAVLHPLLHHNTSDFWEQRFTSHFTGNEFFLADHRVVLAERAVPVLPAVAYLELARGAVCQATGHTQTKVTPSMAFQNVVWATPLVVADGAQKVHISLRLEANAAHPSMEAIAFEVFTETEERVVHCQGLAFFKEWEPVARDLSFASLAHHTTDPDALYRDFRESGLQHGPAYRAVSALVPLPDESAVAAKLVLPACASADAEQFQLHPAVMDAALQASAALVQDGDNAPALPFALDRLEIHGPCTPTMWAYVRPSGAGSRGRIRKCDIDLCDERGQCRVRLLGFSSRLLETPERSRLQRQQPAWENVAVPSHLNPPPYSEHRILHALTEAPAQAQRLPVAKTAAHGYTEAAVMVFETIKTILQRKETTKVLLQVVVPAESSVLSGLIGLLRSAHRENPRLITQLIELDQAAAVSAKHILATCAALPDQDHVRYLGRQRQQLTWREVAAPADTRPALRRDGVYLITGGAGGLGRQLADHIAEQAPEAVVYLVGRRSQPNLVHRGPRRHYRSCDISDHQAVAAMMTEIRREQGRLHGVFHAAGVLDDAFIIHKSSAAFRAVLAPKVAGTWNLAETAGNLDFLALFSSTAGLFGNHGQADYAAANGFLDAFAASHADGRVVSINWPLWRDGGMGLSDDAVQQLAETAGEIPLPTQLGWAVLHHARQLGLTRLLVRYGNRLHLGDDAAPKPISAPAEPTATTATTPPEKAHAYFKNLLAETLKLPADRIRVEEPLERYGIDSILVTQMTNTLETVFGSLSKTLFFEYQTLAELADYFRNHHAARLQALLHGASPQQETVTERAPLKPANTRAPRFQHGPRLLPKTPARDEQDGIAVVGLAGRYPQAADLTAFWDNLAAGRNSITEVPTERWDWRHWFSEDATQTGVHRSRWGGFLDDIACFDPRFFNIAPRDARFMDPQERLFLESCWHAMEDAGYRRDGLPERVGVYAGVMYGEYQLIGLEASPEGRRTATSNLYASIANRVSYTLNLRGPSMTVDTMCSSSLTCLDLAMRDLYQGRTDMAFAGGVNLNLHPNKYTILSDSQFIATRGFCESFGQGGDGYIPGEGVGVAVLKRLSDARRDHDHIYGVIVGAAVNHDGKTNGYTVPNPRAQAAVVHEALREAGLAAEAVTYVEAHGTGTKLGDPIEINGLTRAFSHSTKRTGFCLIGSAKSNIGHCESAAGIAGVTKVLLQLKHGQVAPSLHSATLNPNIDFAATPFVVNQTLRPWPRPENGGPRVAGISSFGAGGANAHLLIREETPPQRTAQSGTWPVLLSAMDDTRLREQAQQLSAWLDRVDGPADTQVELFIRNELAALLQVEAEELERDVPLAEYGIEAVHRHRLHERLAERFDVHQPIPTGTTIAAISRQWAGSANQSAPPFVDLVYTLMVGREPLPARLCLLADGYGALRSALQHFRDGRPSDAVATARVSIDDSDAAFTSNQLATWMTARRFDRLRDAWLEGADPDWAQLWPDPSDKPFRVSLPTYPFARKRYWLPEKQSQAETSQAPSATATQDDLEWLAVAETYRAKPFPEGFDWQAALRQKDGSRIAVVAEKEDAEALASLLTQLGQSLPKGFALEVVTPSALDADFAFAARPDVVLCHTPLRPATAAAQPVETDVAAVFYLSRALMHAAWNKPIQLFHLHQSDESQPRLDLQALAGFLKSAVLENERHRWTCIDAERDLAVSPAQCLLQEWLAATAHGATPFQAVRYRAGHRLSAVLEETPLAQADTPIFRAGATYLLTGGLGPVGILLCRELAQRYQARLVILSRGALDDQRRRQCRDLENLGASVHYHAVDIGDRDALRQTLAQVKTEVGPLHGVIHLARLVEDAPILTKSWASFQRVQQAKVQGTCYLDELTAEEPLDFFVLFSSMAAFGIRGSADYGYSAAFQNAFAAWRRRLQEQRQRQGHTGALCWGFWTVDRYLPANRENVITESGYAPIDMAAAFPKISVGCRHAAAAVGLMGIRDRDKVLQGLGLAPQQPPTRAEIIATQIAHWEQRLQRQGVPLSVDEMRAFIAEREIADMASDLVARLHQLLFPQPAAPATPSVADTRPQPTTTPKPTATASSPGTAAADVAIVIRAALSEVLEIEDIDDQHAFPDYGLDSISGMRLAVMLEKKLAREIDAQWLIDFPSINTLSHHLAAESRPVLN